MSGEDPWQPEGGITGTFRQRCPECGKQIQYVDTQRVRPDCGHETPGIGIDVADLRRFVDRSPGGDE